MSRKAPSPADTEPPRFSEDMVIADLLESHPGVSAVLEAHGLPCHRCIVAPTETLATGCSPLSLEVATIVAELNALPPAPGGGASSAS